MTNLKDVMFKVIKKLIFSIFLATLLLFIFQKAKSQIVGLDKISTKELVKNLQNQVDQQKTQLDTIQTTLGTLESKITEQEESMKKIDSEQEFKKQLEEDKQKLKNAWVSYLSLEPEVTTDQELVEKFDQAKEATNKHEQDFISKLENKKETAKEEPTLEHTVKKIKKEKIQIVEPVKAEVSVETEPTQETTQIIPAPIKEEVAPIAPEKEEAEEQQKPSEESMTINTQTKPTQAQQISEPVQQEEAVQESEKVEPSEQISETIFQSENPEQKLE